MQKLVQKIKSEKGFTLIELLVVIVIIGILAAVAAITLLNQTGKGNVAQAESNVTAAYNAALIGAQEQGGFVADGEADSTLDTVEENVDLPNDDIIGGTAADDCTADQADCAAGKLYVDYINGTTLKLYYNADGTVRAIGYAGGKKTGPATWALVNP